MTIPQYPAEAVERLRECVFNSMNKSYWGINPGLIRADDLAALLSYVEGMKWQPIESAPRDGTHILIAFGSDWVSSAIYCSNDDDAHPWKFLDQQGQSIPILNGARDDKYGPTRWLPLPPAPDGE